MQVGTITYKCKTDQPNLLLNRKNKIISYTPIPDNNYTILTTRQQPTFRYTAHQKKVIELVPV